MTDRDAENQGWTPPNGSPQDPWQNSALGPQNSDPERAWGETEEPPRTQAFPPAGETDYPQPTSHYPEGLPPQWQQSYGAGGHVNAGQQQHGPPLGYYQGSGPAQAVDEGGSRSGKGPTIAIIALCLALLVVGGMLLYSFRDKDGQPVAAPVPSTTSQSSAPSSTPSSESSTSSTTSETSTSETAPIRPPTGEISPGLTEYGWTGKIECNAADRWVWAGGNGSDYAVVCRVGEDGDLYYRGLFRGGVAEHDIAEFAAGPGGFYRTENDHGTSIYINGDRLIVFDENDQQIADTSFNDVHYR